MFSSFRAAIRPLVFAILFTMTSAGAVLADNSYGGTDPPKTNDGIAFVTSLVNGSTDAASLWAQLSQLFARWFAAMN